MTRRHPRDTAERGDAVLADIVGIPNTGGDW